MDGLYPLRLVHNAAVAVVPALLFGGGACGVLVAVEGHADGEADGLAVHHDLRIIRKAEFQAGQLHAHVKFEFREIALSVGVGVCLLVLLALHEGQIVRIGNGPDCPDGDGFRIDVAAGGKLRLLVHAEGVGAVAVEAAQIGVQLRRAVPCVNVEAIRAAGELILRIFHGHARHVLPVVFDGLGVFEIEEQAALEIRLPDPGPAAILMAGVPVAAQGDIHHAGGRCLRAVHELAGRGVEVGDLPGGILLRRGIAAEARLQIAVGILLGSQRTLGGIGRDGGDEGRQHPHGVLHGGTGSRIGDQVPRHHAVGGLQEILMHRAVLIHHGIEHGLVDLLVAHIADHLVGAARSLRVQQEEARAVLLVVEAAVDPAVAVGIIVEAGGEDRGLHLVAAFFDRTVIEVEDEPLAVQVRPGEIDGRIAVIGLAVVQDHVVVILVEVDGLEVCRGESDRAVLQAARHILLPGTRGRTLEIGAEQAFVEPKHIIPAGTGNSIPAAEDILHILRKVFREHRQHAVDVHQGVAVPVQRQRGVEIQNELLSPLQHDDQRIVPVQVLQLHAVPEELHAPGPVPVLRRLFDAIIADLICRRQIDVRNDIGIDVGRDGDLQLRADIELPVLRDAARFDRHLGRDQAIELVVLLQMIEASHRILVFRVANLVEDQRIELIAVVGGVEFQIQLGIRKDAPAQRQFPHLQAEIVLRELDAGGIAEIAPEVEGQHAHVGFIRAGQNVGDFIQRVFVAGIIMIIPVGLDVFVLPAFPKRQGEGPAVGIVIVVAASVILIEDHLVEQVAAVFDGQIEGFAVASGKEHEYIRAFLAILVIVGRTHLILVVHGVVHVHTGEGAALRKIRLCPVMDLLIVLYPGMGGDLLPVAPALVIIAAGELIVIALLPEHEGGVAAVGRGRPLELRRAPGGSLRRLLRSRNRRGRADHRIRLIDPGLHAAALAPGQDRGQVQAVLQLEDLSGAGELHLRRRFAQGGQMILAAAAHAAEHHIEAQRLPALRLRDQRDLDGLLRQVAEEHKLAARRGILLPGPGGVVHRLPGNGQHVVRAAGTPHGQLRRAFVLVHLHRSDREAHLGGQLILVVLDHDGHGAVIRFDIRAAVGHHGEHAHLLQLRQVVVQHGDADVFHQLVLRKGQGELHLVEGVFHRDREIIGFIVEGKPFLGELGQLLRERYVGLSPPGAGAEPALLRLVDQTEVIGFQILRRQKQFFLLLGNQGLPDAAAGLRQLPLPLHGLHVRHGQRQRELLVSALLKNGGFVQGRHARHGQSLILRRGIGVLRLQAHVVQRRGRIVIGITIVIDPAHCRGIADRDLRPARAAAQAVDRQHHEIQPFGLALMQVRLEIAEGEGAVFVGFLPGHRLRVRVVRRKLRRDDVAFRIHHQPGLLFGSQRLQGQRPHQHQHGQKHGEHLVQSSYHVPFLHLLFAQPPPPFRRGGAFACLFTFCFPGAPRPAPVCPRSRSFRRASASACKGPSPGFRRRRRPAPSPRILRHFQTASLRRCTCLPLRPGGLLPLRRSGTAGRGSGRRRMRPGPASSAAPAFGAGRSSGRAGKRLFRRPSA